MKETKCKGSFLIYRLKKELGVLTVLEYLGKAPYKEDGTALEVVRLALERSRHRQNYGESLSLILPWRQYTSQIYMKFLEPRFLRSAKRNASKLRGECGYHHYITRVP